MGKPKMWNISKTTDRGVKRTEIWDSGYYSAHIEDTFDLQTLLLSHFSSDSSKHYTRCHDHTGCHFFGDLPNIAKIMAF